MTADLAAAPDPLLTERYLKEEWCILNLHNDDSLCGAVSDGPIIPMREGIEETICKDCLRIYAKIERNSALHVYPS
jgi:hypothetical protein